MWKAADVTVLRERLGVDRPTFARIVGVDTRTVFRWEAGEVTPSGAAEAILTGLREKLNANPETADQVIKFVVGAAAIGGLAYLVVKMLDAAAPPAAAAKIKSAPLEKSEADRITEGHTEGELSVPRF